MKIVCISDLHGNLIDNVPEADVLVISGDLCPATDHSISFQSNWLDIPFRSWLEKQPVDKIIGIAGNHDFIFEQAPGLVPYNLKWSYLKDSGITYNNVKFYGHPWTPNFYDWAFMPRNNASLIPINDAIPDDTDVLITHGPPKGHLDTVEGVMTMGKDGNVVLEHLGCEHLKNRVDKIPNIKYHIFGHIHSSHGQDGRFINASVLDERYHVNYEPIIIEV